MVREDPFVDETCLLSTVLDGFSTKGLLVKRTAQLNAHHQFKPDSNAVL